MLYNLSFCDSVAYSAPANFENPDIPNPVLLGQKYDDFAKSQYKNFSRSLQQIPCDTTSSAQYSLTRNCDDCAKAYKNWLCAVTIPRCEDPQNSATYLLPRAIGRNSTNTTLSNQTKDDPNMDLSDTIYEGHTANSRTLMIDKDINPRPYKEVLPCADLCYDLVQSCPASLQFVCPLEKHGLNFTYGLRKKNEPGRVTCSFPGAGINRNSIANRSGPSAGWIALTVILMILTT